MTRKGLINLLKDHHEDGYRWACQCCRYDEVMARDVLQEVYEKILRGKAKYNGKSTVKTWFFSVIRFTAIDHMRKKHDHMPIEYADGREAHSVDPGGRDFRSILARLSPKQAEVLLLVFYHDHTLEEAASVMGVSVGTVRTHYHRGKTNVKEMLKNEYHG